MMIQILPIQNQDLEEIIKIEEELYHKPWKIEDFMYELHNNPYAYYLKMQDKESKEIMGYIGFWIKFDQAEITKVSIAKKYQGHKLSKILMEDCERRVKLAQCINITLEVRVSNIVAISLYTKCGFKIVATRKKYYENGEDAYLMLKEFN